MPDEEPRSRALPVRIASAIALVLVVGVWFLLSSDGQGMLFDRNQGEMEFSEAQEFTSFPLYSVGESFEDIPLTKITRRLDTPQPPEYFRTNFVNFIYGDCEPTGDAGCAPPFQIQVWPACIRTLSSYTMGSRPYPHEQVTVRGVPAAVFHDTRVEVYTGRVTVVIFASKEFGLRVAEALERVNGSEPLSSDEPLPPPANGALEGKLTCTGAEYGAATPTISATTAPPTLTIEWTPTKEATAASPLTTWDPSQVEAFNQAAMGPGTLEISTSCVLLILEDGTKVLPVWPEPTDWKAASRTIEYVSPFGNERTQLQAGDRITLGGSSTMPESFALYVRRPTPGCEAQAESAYIISEVRVESE